MMNIKKLKNDKTGAEIGWALWVGGKIALVFGTPEAAQAAMDMLLEQHWAELLEDLEQGLIKTWVIEDFLQELNQLLSEPAPEADQKTATSPQAPRG